jgi:hypothetical protein
LFALAVLAPVIVALPPANVGAQAPSALQHIKAEKDKMNSWTVGLAGHAVSVLSFAQTGVHHRVTRWRGSFGALTTSIPFLSPY